MPAASRPVSLAHRAARGRQLTAGTARPMATSPSRDGARQAKRPQSFAILDDISGLAICRSRADCPVPTGRARSDRRKRRDICVGCGPSLSRTTPARPIAAAPIPPRSLSGARTLIPGRTRGTWRVADGAFGVAYACDTRCGDHRKHAQREEIRSFSRIGTTLASCFQRHQITTNETTMIHRCAGAHRHRLLLLPLVVLASHRLGRHEYWKFAHLFPQQLRLTIDPDWYRELPRTYYYSPDHSHHAVSGKLSAEQVERRICTRSSGDGSGHDSHPRSTACPCTRPSATWCKAPRRGRCGRGACRSGYVAGLGIGQGPRGHADGGRIRDGPTC